MGRNDYTPKELCRILRRTVMGQDNYLKKLSVTMWLHNERVKLGDKRYEYSDLHLQKSHLLCIGPTGSGKTLAVTTLAKIYGYKMIVADMSGYTGAGWKGKNAEELVKDLYLECNQNKKETERGIIIMDEIDKALLQGRDERYPTASVENTLLKMLEGTEVTFELNDRNIRIDTTNILFIASGAFEGIEEIIKKRVKKKTVIGFGKSGYEKFPDDFYYIEHLERKDLMEYGVGRQLLGRFADLAVLNQLSTDDMTKILLESDISVIRSLDNTLKYSCGVRVTMDEAGARVVAEQAILENTGVRGLAQIIQPVINEAIFLMDSDPSKGDAFNEIHLSAQDGELRVFYKKGAKFKFSDKKISEVQNKRKYNFPKAKRSHVEHFSWHVLSYYLDVELKPYLVFESMHSLLCSIVFYLYEECNVDDRKFSSIGKLVDESVYHILISDIEKSRPSLAREYFDKFQKGFCMGIFQELKDALQAFEVRAHVIK